MNWIANWEIAIWLGGGENVVNDFCINAKDQRIRCPLCVVSNLHVGMNMPGSEVKRRERGGWIGDQDALLDETKPRKWYKVSRWNGETAR